MEAPAEIKVKTRKFSLTKGTIKISFELEGSRGRIRSLKLKQRNAVLDTSFPFEMQTAKKGNTIVYHAQINVDQYPMETAFWDVVASVDKEGKGNDPFSKMDQNRGWAYGLSLCQRSKAVYHSIPEI